MRLVISSSGDWNLVDVLIRVLFSGRVVISDCKISHANGIFRKEGVSVLYSAENCHETRLRSQQPGSKNAFAASSSEGSYSSRNALKILFLVLFFLKWAVSHVNQCKNSLLSALRGPQPPFEQTPNQNAVEPWLLWILKHLLFKLQSIKNWFKMVILSCFDGFRSKN